MTGPGTSSNAYADLDAYVRLPRLSGLALSPDGARLVTAVATANAGVTAYASALWEVDPAGTMPARRLTRSRKGESGPVFAGDGTVLFTSARSDPDAAEDDDDSPPALWALPPAGRRASSAPAPVVSARCGRPRGRCWCSATPSRPRPTARATSSAARPARTPR